MYICTSQRELGLGWGFVLGLFFLISMTSKGTKKKKDSDKLKLGLGGGKEQSIGISQDIGFKEGGERRKYRGKKGPSR